MSQSNTENNAAHALIQIHNGDRRPEHIPTPVKEVPFNPEDTRGKFHTLTGRTPVDGFPYHGSSRDGLPHGNFGVEFFQIDGNLFLYAGQYHKGNPHGPGTLYRNLHHHMGNDNTIRSICNMKFDVWKTKTNDFKDLSFLDPTTTPSVVACTYTGTFHKKEPFHLAGKGIYREEKCTVVGTFKTEKSGDTLLFKFDGKVDLTYSSGDVFKGYLHDYDEFFPKSGFYTWKNGTTMRGTFSDPYGTNITTQSSYGCYVDGNDQSSYTGSFIGDLKHGEGVLIFKSGETFVGTWYSDVPTVGKLTTPEKGFTKQYNGKVNRAFKPHGEGKMEYVRGNAVFYTFSGVFKNGKKHGVGFETLTYDDHGVCKITGEWNEDVMVKGTETFTSSVDSKYNYKREGRIVGGRMSFGKYWHSNGDLYHGNFDKNFQASGLGVLTQASGKVFCGTWCKNKKHGKHDVMTRGTLATPLGTEPQEFYYEHHLHQYTNGLLQNATTVSTKKRKRDFETFKESCRQRVQQPIP